VVSRTYWSDGNHQYGSYRSVAIYMFSRPLPFSENDLMSDRGHMQNVTKDLAWLRGGAMPTDERESVILLMLGAVVLAL
jgi:Tfp pilus assembly PilM family ATPase